jgi:hypothetical protein
MLFYDFPLCEKLSVGVSDQDSDHVNLSGDLTLHANESGVVNALFRPNYEMV